MNTLYFDALVLNRLYIFPAVILCTNIELVLGGLCQEGPGYADLCILQV